jgi:glycosyltransferase involved in cell wall biosynthesis
MPTIGLSMIVKNAEADLRPCLESVRGVVDQIVIADTGSTDNTVAVAKEFGAIVVFHPWSDHYAEARNIALKPVTTDWVLVLDADEELSREAASSIRQLLERAESDEKVGGYSLPIRSYMHNPLGSVLGAIARENTDNVERARGARSHAEHRLCRLFRRHPEIYFSGRVHEGVELQIYNAGYTCLPAELRILHYGHLAEETGYRKKHEYYRKILRMAVEETPHYPHLWIQLALVERKYFDNIDGALECARKAVALSPEEYEGWHMIAGFESMRQHHAPAIEALKHLPDTGEWGITKGWSLGDLFFNLGRFKEARTMYAAALDRIAKSRKTFPAEFTSSIESRLGYTEVQLGMYKVGFRKLHQAVHHEPMVLENHNRLMRAYVLTKNDSAAADVAEATLQHILSEKLFARAATLRFRLGEFDRAAKLLRAGLQLFPQSENLQSMQRQLELNGAASVPRPEASGTA